MRRTTQNPQSSTINKRKLTNNLTEKPQYIANHSGQSNMERIDSTNEKSLTLSNALSLNIDAAIKKTGDISKRLRLIHAVQNRRQIFANGFANSPVLGLRLKTEIGCGGIVEGGFHPQAVIWVIRLTSPHLP